MTKTELIDAVAKEAEKVTKADVAKIINSTFDTISASLKSGNSVTLIGFGTFSVTNRKARTGRNPRSGTAIKIPEAKVPKFSAGKGLKELVNGV